MLLRPFGRELLCFEYLDISLLDLTGIFCCIDKISLQQQISLMKARMPLIIDYSLRVALFLIY